MNWNMKVDASSMVDINNGLFCIEYWHICFGCIYSVAVEYEVANKTILPERRVKYTRTYTQPDVIKQMWIYPTLDAFCIEFKDISGMIIVPKNICNMTVLRGLINDPYSDYRIFIRNCSLLKLNMMNRFTELNDEYYYNTREH
jgi:hypothetical protein